MTDAGILFLSLLAVVAQAGTLALLVDKFAGRRLAPLVAPVALSLAALVAVVSTAGSLWFSEGAGFTPCKLCWYQRIAMYPLAIILPVAAWRRHAAVLVRWYAVPLAAIGAAISTYHVAIERFPRLESGSCDPTNPCSLIWFERFGYLTIPAMALSGFLAIIVLLFVATSPVEGA